MSKSSKKGLEPGEFMNFKKLTEKLAELRERTLNETLQLKRTTDLLDKTDQVLYKFREDLVAKYGEVRIDGEGNFVS